MSLSSNIYILLYFSKGCVVKPSRPRSKSCVHLLSGVKEGNLALFRSCSLSRSESSHPMKKKKKQESETPPLSSSPTEEEASKGDPLEQDLPEPGSSDEGSEKCSTSRCSEDNMDYLVRTLFYSIICGVSSDQGVLFSMFLSGRNVFFSVFLLFCSLFV